MDLTLWLELGLFIVLMALSGFFSSSETAMFSLDSIQLQQMRLDKNPRVDLIERMLSQPRRLIITILIGNELVNVAASVISAAVVIQFLGAENKWMNLFIMVPILLLVGEITPKTLAIRNNVRFATAESAPIEFFARMIKPIRWLVRIVADTFITLLVGKERSQGNIVTGDMVRTLAREAVGEGTLDVDEAKFIDQIFDFGSKTLENVMTLRSDISFLSIDTPLNEVVKQQRASRHSKIPVYREHRDTVIGILHARDLLGARTEIFADKDKEGGWEKLLREPYFVPESKPAAELFDVFRKRKVSVALTVDEYGGVTGLVTMEDLLECIFGDIHSPSDDVLDTYIRGREDGHYDVDGAVPIADLNEALGCELSDEFGETLAGLLLHEYGELPPEQTIIALNGLRFTVEAVSDNRIKQVSLEPMPVDNRASDDAGTDDAGTDDAGTDDAGTGDLESESGGKQ